MRKRTCVAAVLAASWMLVVGVGSASAVGPNKSFDATFCYATSYEGVSPALVATVTWSGYRVNTISIGIGDGSGAGFGAFFPVTAARSGTEIVYIGVDNSAPFGGVDIRNGNHIWASEPVDAPTGDWANLPAC